MYILLSQFVIMIAYWMEAKRLYRLVDIDGTESVPADEFLNGLLSLRGNARALELSLMKSDFRRFQKKFDSHRRIVEKKLETIAASMKR